MTSPSPSLPSRIDSNCSSVIGIRGDKSCAALLEHAHCQNCPTYSEIAASLLDRPLIDEPLDAQTWVMLSNREMGKSKDSSHLIFRLGVEWLCIAVDALDEVVELRAIHRIPHRTNPALLGVANVRGELVVCVSLARLLGIDPDPSEVSHTRRFLILRSASGCLAVPVDEAQHTFAFEAGDMISVPATVTHAAGSYTTGLVHWRDRTVASLDAARVLQAFEMCLG